MNAWQRLRRRSASAVRTRAMALSEVLIHRSSAARAHARRQSRVALKTSRRTLCALAKRVKTRGWRGIVRSMLAPAIAAALVAWALLEAHAVLPVSGAPTVASPLVAAVMPSEDVHTTSNGYLLALDINVKNCSDPVHVFAQLVLPTEYYRA